MLGVLFSDPYLQKMSDGLQLCSGVMPLTLKFPPLFLVQATLLTVLSVLYWGGEG